MAKELNLLIDQGTDVSTNVIAYTNTTTTTVLDMSNYTAGYGQIRKTYSSATHTANLSVNVWVSNTSGLVGLSMNNVVTSAITEGRYVYDVEIVSNDTPAKITRIRQGILTIAPEVTKV